MQTYYLIKSHPTIPHQSTIKSQPYNDYEQAKAELDRRHQVDPNCQLAISTRWS